MKTLTLPEGPVRETYRSFVEDRTAVELMWVGGIGCSKSDALVTRAGFIADAYPGGRSVIARSDSVKLAGTTLVKFREKWDHDGLGVFHQLDGELKVPVFRWANGHITLFLGLGDYKAIQRLKSLEVVAVGFDEADEIDEETWMMALGRIRQQLPGIDVHRTVYGVANYEGRNWIWQRFKSEEPLNPKRNRRLLEASSYDNHSLPPDYLPKLEVNGPSWVRQYLRGSWDTASGLIFPEFNPNLHAREPIVQKDDWAYIVGIDHGFKNPTAATLWGVDARGVWRAPREYYETGITPAENARNIKMWAGPNVFSFVIDPSTFNEDPRNPGQSIAFDYQQAGLSVQRGNNNLEAGIARVRALLRPFDDNGRLRARMYLDPSMVNTIREFQTWRWKDVRDAGREVPENGNDHALDSLRYAVMSVSDAFRAGPAKSNFRFEDDEDDDEPRVKPRKSIGGY